MVLARTGFPKLLLVKAYRPTVIVETVFLEQIYDVELVSNAGNHVLKAEIIPRVNMK